MHGEIKPHDTRMSDDAIVAESRILKSGFADLLRPNAPKPIDWTEVIGNMTFQIEETGGEMAPDNSALPAAYTYFGQLVTHDITAHRFLNSKPQLRLHTLYGLGSASSPQFFQHEWHPKEGFMFRGVKLTLDEYLLEGSADQEVVYDFFRVHRQRQGQEGHIPLMADARNDQNFITSQLVVKLAQLHNRLAEDFFDRSISPGHLFEKTSQELVRKYQTVILTDYLPRILHESVAKELHNLAKGIGFVIFDPTKECQLSEVFSRAAMRFGHSMARQMYQVQLQRQQIHLFNADIDLRGFSRNHKRKIDWLCLLEERKNGPDNVAFQPAKAFDTNIVLSLNNLPFFPGGNRSLVGKNIENSYQNFVLNKEFWKALQTAGIEPIEDKFLKGWADKFKIKLENMPLWVYFLLEAETFTEGKTLGPLASHLIAEQIIWAIRAEPESILKADGAELVFGPKSVPYTLKQLLEEAGEDFGPQKQALLPKYWTSRGMASRTPLAASNALLRSRSVYLGDEAGLQYQWRTNPNGLWRLPYGTDPVIPERQVDFPADSASAQIARSAILKNGYYWYPVSESEAAIDAHIKNGTLPSDSVRKREIRCYVSRDLILKFCGASVPDPDPNVDHQDEIKGLFFILALDKKSGPVPKICLLARRTGVNGALPTDVQDEWRGSNEITVGKPANSKEAESFMNDFVIDQYSTFKTNGLPTQTFFLNDLLELLGYKKLVSPITINVHLISATGQEIADGEGYELTSDDAAYASIGSKSFFSLALTTDNVTAVGPGRTYPPDCYPRSIVWR